MVLAITSVLLLLLFSVAGRGVSTGFRLADRSLGAADRQVGTEALRVLLRGVRLPDGPGQPTLFVGEPDALTAAMIPLRETACTGAAPAAVVRLRIDARAGRSRLVCQGPGGRMAVLVDLGPGPAAFSYALAGRPWSDRLIAAPPPPSLQNSGGRARPSARLWVRLAGADGAFEVVEAVDPAPTLAASIL